jgi:hypothetical protein
MARSIWAATLDEIAHAADARIDIYQIVRWPRISGCAVAAESPVRRLAITVANGIDLHQLPPGGI